MAAARLRSSKRVRRDHSRDSGGYKCKLIVLYALKLGHSAMRYGPKRLFGDALRPRSGRSNFWAFISATRHDVGGQSVSFSQPSICVSHRQGDTFGATRDFA
eukprot:3116952-Prymnesium_polylepis.1